MPNDLQLQNESQEGGRTIAAPAIFAAFPEHLQNELRHSAIRRTFAPGQIVQHRGDTAESFWIIDKGQVKLGRFGADGVMQALFIMGKNDSFGEMACLGHFPRVLDAEAVGDLEMLCVSEAAISAAIAASPEVARNLLRIVAVQLQEALDNLIVLRNLPAGNRLARQLLALAAGKTAPVTIAIRQQDLADLVGVSRMTIVSALAELEAAGLVARQYRQIVIPDPKALKAWMRRTD
jgi:CRP/FNR family transcriptional regulator, cyclic AMP receptor protein